MALGETHNNGTTTTQNVQQAVKSPTIAVAAANSAPVTTNTTTNTTQNILNGTNNDKRHAKQVDANTAFLRAARAGDLEKLIEFLDTGDVSDINASNANGLNALHLAAKDGHIDIVRELLRRGAGVDNATKKGNSALHIASLAGQKEIIKILIQHLADVNLQSQNGFTPLYMAAQENHDTCVKYLLAKGANQALATEDGFTPLAVAMQQGHEKVVAVLLETDARGKVRLPALHIAAKKDDVKAATLLLESERNPDVSSKSGFTPLHIAAHYGNLDVANLLIDKGADVNFAAKHNITPLHVACKWGKTQMVNLLIAKGADINSLTRDGLTPLHCAARSGHDKVIDVLSENHAHILSKTKNGLAPLHMAAQGEHVDAARALLYHNAPVDDVTVDYLTALHVAAHCGHVKVARLLVSRNADPNARALNGFTPLHIACKKNRIKVVELLLKHGASKSATTESGLTPLHVASFMGCMNIVIYLLQHDASPDVPTVRGETPLHLAARANQTDIIRILLRNGAQVDAKAREEQTPLHVAARLGNVDIVMLLLQHGANIDSITKDLYTPLHIAAKEGQDEVAAILIENGAQCNATTKKGFTPLHLAGKYGNIKVAELLLQKGAPVDAQGKNGVTPLHVASHYDHQKVALLLLEKGASPHASAKNGHTPLHIAAKKNQMDIATTLLEYGALADAESKSGFTPIHLSAQEGHADMSALLLAHKASPNRAAKNGLTPLHLCAQEDKVAVAQILLDNQANIDSTTKAGFTPLHVAAHFGQINMVKYLLEHDATIEKSTNIGYTPLHQAAQQGHTLIINLLLKHKANPNAVTNNGQTALNIANKLGYITVVESLKVVTETNIVSSTVAGNNNQPTVVTTTTTTATAGGGDEKYKVIAPESMHETFMSDSEDEGGGGNNDESIYDTNSNSFNKNNNYTNNNNMAAGPNNVQNKSSYNLFNPILMSYYNKKSKECEDPIMSDPQQYKYMTVDDIKGLDDNIKLDTNDDKAEKGAVNEFITNLQHLSVTDAAAANVAAQMAANNAHQQYMPKQLDNIDIVRQPINVGCFDVLNTLTPHLAYFGGRRKTTPMCRERFLVSFLVDARGGAMRGCRHSGVRVIVPPRSAAQPTRITCRYVKPQRIPNPPPLMEGEALVSRILELAPVAAKFLGPVILEVPHFASLRDKEREIIILRSDNGETWREHTLYDSEEAIQDVLNESFEAGELTQLEDLHTNRIIRIVTHDFPHFFAIVSRIRQEVHAIGPDGGTVSSAAVPQVQAVFPPNALTKKIRVGLQAQPIDSNSTAMLLGRGVAVSPVVTVEPRRRKFHKAITLSMPAPKAHTQGMINQYSGNAPTLRLLCSITGGQNRAIWEDVTGSTPLTFVKDCVSFTTTVSARFWLMDCRNITEACKMATELYTHMAYVPFMVKFVVFAKRTDLTEAKLSVFCMTDDKEDKTLEQQEHFHEVAKSRDCEILEGRPVYLEFAGNIIPIMKSGEQLNMEFSAFKENRLAFTVKIKENDDLFGRITFMNEPKVAKGEPSLTPICTLNIVLPDEIYNDDDPEQHQQHQLDLLNRNYRVLLNGRGGSGHQKCATTNGQLLLSKDETDINEIHKADIRLSDICNLLGSDWEKLAYELDVPDADVQLIRSEYPNADQNAHQAMVMLRLWLRQSGKQATGNNLEQALHRIKRSDIVDKCIFNLELVTDEMEKAVAKIQLDQSGFENLKDELGGSRESSMSQQPQSKHHDYLTSDDEDSMIIRQTVVTPAENQKVKLVIDENAAAIRQLRDQAGTTLGISTQSKANGENETPPPSPADFFTNNSSPPLSAATTTTAPTARAELSDLSGLLDENNIESLIIDPTTREYQSIVNSMSSEEIYHQINSDINEICDQAEEEANAKLNADDDKNAQLTVVLDEFERDLDTRKVSFNVNGSDEEVDEEDEEEQQSIPFRPVEKLSNITKNFIQMEQQGIEAEAKIESKIPISSTKTSTPIKVKTIKKHSKVNRDLTKLPNQPIRPAVGDIEWDLAAETEQLSLSASSPPPHQITEISTLNLEDVISPLNDLQSFEPVVIISPSDDYSGEIDEVILVQTPGEDDRYDSTSYQDHDGGEITIITEEHYENGEIHRVDQATSKPSTTTTEVTTSIIDNDGQRTTTTTTTTMSMSLSSSDNEEDDYPESPFQGRRTTKESHTTTTTIIEQQHQQPQPRALSAGSGGTGSNIGIGSSSGSDVALHEAGAELSDDESETDFYQSNDQSFNSGASWGQRENRCYSLKLGTAENTVGLFGSQDHKNSEEFSDLTLLEKNVTKKQHEM